MTSQMELIDKVFTESPIGSFTDLHKIVKHSEDKQQYLDHKLHYLSSNSEDGFCSKSQSESSASPCTEATIYNTNPKAETNTLLKSLSKLSLSSDLGGSFSDLREQIKNSTATYDNFIQKKASFKVASCSMTDLDVNGVQSSCDEDWDSEGRPTGERWPPLGAPNDDEENSMTSYEWYGIRDRQGDGSDGAELKRLKILEEEQEQLNNSLMALTSHFAQVQFRLKQIVDAVPEEKEDLLKELEEFANRGIPDLRKASISTEFDEDDNVDPDFHKTQERQRELIDKLKSQLEDLESYAYETGGAGLPQNIVLEKQKVIIDQLKGKLNLNVDNFDKLSVDDLKQHVDSAVKELVNPLRMKEQLVTQLQTQIVDLERFIQFLQGEGPDPGTVSPTKCQCNGHSPSSLSPTHPLPSRKNLTRKQSFKSSTKPSKTKQISDQEKLKNDTENLIKRAMTLMNMLKFAQFGCGPGDNFPGANSLKKTPQGNHWGDQRAALEVAVERVLQQAVSSLSLADSDYTSDSESTHAMATSEELTISVRKHLSPALRDLIQHGLMPVGQSQSLVPFLACFPQRSHKPTKLLHAWDLILKYYHLKKGDQYNKTPARKLSQSFNLEITGNTGITNKQTLLGTIGSIMASHTPLKRSFDSQFKAFVCAALNQNKLVTWLRLIFRTQTLLENYYQPWSYTAKTGFDDALRSLDKLNKYNFNLSVDVAVRPFNNIKDAF